MGRLKSISGHETDPVFALRILGVGDGIVHLHRDPESLKLAHDVDHLPVADIGNVLLEREAKNRHACLAAVPAVALHDHSDALAGYSSPHRIVHSPAGENDLWMVSRPLCSMCQVVRIDADAVTADQAGREAEEIPWLRRAPLEY